MIPDYHQFIVEALSNCSARDRSSAILHHAFRMFDKKDCNELIQANIKHCSADTIGEYFHKQFRQIDMTDNGHLDMIIWHAMQTAINIHDMLRFIHENQEAFKTKTVNRLVDDFDFR